MTRSTRTYRFMMTGAVLLGFAVWAICPASAQTNVVDNVLVNGDFESGDNWGGTSTPPVGWIQTDASAGSYLNPEMGPLFGARSLVTEGNGAERGQITRQRDLVMDPHWQLEFDFAWEDPPLARDEICMSLQIEQSPTGAYVVIWVKDADPDDDGADLWARDPGVTKIGDITNFIFSGEGSVLDTTIFTAPVIHHFVLEGRFDQPTPSYDIHISRDGTNLASFVGLQNWNNQTPSQGDSPTGLAFIGDSFSTGLGQYDNVVMGSAVQPAASSVATGEVFELVFDSQAGTFYTLESTTDLVGQPFATKGVSMTAPAAGALRFADPGTLPNEVYRISAQDAP